MEQQEKKDFLDFVLFKVVEGIVSDALAEPDIILLNFMVENENQQDRIISECREYVLKIIVDLIYKGSAGILTDDEVGIFKLDSRDMDNIKKIVISGMYGSERR